MHSKVWLFGACALAMFCPSIYAADGAAPDLSLKISCLTETIKAGDEIVIEFKITNEGQQVYDYHHRADDRYRHL